MNLATNDYSATVDITTRCNLHCKHCRTESVNYDLTLQQIEEIAQKISNPKRRVVFISGGEPLMRNDIVEIVRIFKKYVPCVCINTNSLLLTEHMLDALIDAGLNYIQVSLDGTEETHDYMRGIGSYQKTIQQMKLINTRPIKLHVSCCISRLNLDAMYDFADQVLRVHKIQVDILGFKRFIPKNEMAGVYNLGADGLRQLYENFEAIQSEFSGMSKIVVDFPQKNVFHREMVLETMEKFGLSCSGCSAATGGPCIRADGSVSPCSLLYLNVGSIFAHTLEELYQTEVFTNLCNRALKGKCGTCKDRLICGGCRAAAMALHQDYLAEDTECFLC